MSERSDRGRSILLFTVTDTFMITGRGLVLAPGPNEHVPGFRTGAILKLIRPDGSILNTTVKGIVHQSPYDLLVGTELTKTDVPLGTEVWLTP